MTFFVLLSFFVYCYRFHVHRAACALYLQHVRNSNVLMSQMQHKTVSDDRGPVLIQKPLPNAAALLSNIEAAALVSPYQLNPGYRKPAGVAGGGGDSDNGYSTMATDEDSEHMGPVFNPLLLGKGVHDSLMSISSTSDSSSPVVVGSRSIAAKSLPLTTAPAPLLTKTLTSFETSFSTEAQVHRHLDPQEWIVPIV